MKDSHRLQITVSENLFQQMKKAAEDMSCSISALCNIGMTEYVRKLNRKNQTDSTNEKREK